MHIVYEHNAWHIDSIKNLGFLALIDPPTGKEKYMSGFLGQT